MVYSSIQKIINFYTDCFRTRDSYDQLADRDAFRYIMGVSCLLLHVSFFVLFSWLGFQTGNVGWLLGGLIGGVIGGGILAYVGVWVFYYLLGLMGLGFAGKLIFMILSFIASALAWLFSQNF